jgi:hypothetical protein
MDDRNCLAHYPFIVVRIACRVCSRRWSNRLARLAAKFGPEITLRDLLERFSYDCLWRAEARSKRGQSACGVYLPDLEQLRPTSREGWAKLYVPLSTEIIAQCWRPISQSAVLQGRRSQPRPKDFS